MVPTEKVVEVRRGRKVDAERKFFPGYVLVRANLTDEVFSLIKNTPKVTGFLGDSRPVPITDAEADRILHQVQEGVDRPKPSVTLRLARRCVCPTGRSTSFSGSVQEVDEEAARVSRSRYRIFGRAVRGGSGIRSGRKGLTVWSAWPPAGIAGLELGGR